MIRHHILSLFSLFFIIPIPTIHAVENDAANATVCSCSPSVYDFTIDFSLSCPIGEPLELILEDGIDSAECAITPNDTTNITQQSLIPTAITTIMIREIGQNNTVLVEQSITGKFMHGDSFRYITYLASTTSTGDDNNTNIPKVIQFDFTAQNVFGEDIMAVFLIEFANDCTSYPIIQTGHTGGWIRFVSTALSCAMSKMIGYGCCFVQD